MQQPKDLPVVVPKSVAKSKAASKHLTIQLPPPSPSPILLPSQVSPQPLSLPLVQDSVSPVTDLTPNTSLVSSDTNLPNTSTPKPKAERQSSIDSASRLQIQTYLHTVSGQLKVQIIQEKEHDYAKPCHICPDPLIRAHAAKFLFMKNFPRHLNRLNYSTKDDDIVDIISFEEPKKIPFLTPRPPSLPITVDEDESEIDSSITDSWTCEMNKLWTRANKIMYSDRIARLSCEGNVNEVLLKRNLQEQTANKFRELFAATFWEPKLIQWLHNTLMEYFNPNYKNVYIDSLQILKHKIPSLVETFYPAKVENKTKPFLNDPLFNTLSHYKLKKLPRKPIFIIVPNGPFSSANQSVRLKYWHSMFSSMGKVITIPITAKGNDYISDIFVEIRCLANEKIKNAKNVFANRPVILVGFNYGSIIAAHCALQNQKSICAVVCLGFPLKGPSGNRGELDDPLLEITVPMQFIIGENAVMTSLDDIEDFRERMTKTETSLIVVGGADDKLVVSNLKKRLECLTQSMVDRCVADEIFNFLFSILPHYNEDTGSTEPRPLQLLINSSDSFHIPKSKKKSSKKRTTPANEDGTTPTSGVANSEKPPPPKRKRPSKPKTPKPELNPVLIANPGLMAPFPLQSQMFPNLTSVLNNFTPEKINNTANNKALNPLAPIKVDNSKFIIAENSKGLPTGVVPSPVLKKNTKKSVGSVGSQNSISLPSIKEEASPVKSDIHHSSSSLINDSPALSALLKSPVPKPDLPQLKKLPELAVPLNPVMKTLSASPPDGTTPLSGTPKAAPTTPLPSESKTPLSHTSSPKDAYPLSEVPLIHQSSTRTGRPIKPPKSLDI